MKDSSSLCDEPVFTAVFREHSDNLFRYLFYKTGNTALAQDLTQEAFLKMWQNCAKVLLETANKYVFTIANNLLRNEHKHQQVVWKFREKPTSDQDFESPEYLMEEKEWKSRIENAIADLPEKQRVVFLLSRIDKKTYGQIADLLGISKKAVEKRMYLALEVLRKVSKKIK